MGTDSTVAGGQPQRWPASRLDIAFSWKGAESTESVESDEGGTMVTGGDNSNENSEEKAGDTGPDESLEDEDSEDAWEDEGPDDDELFEDDEEDLADAY